MKRKKVVIDIDSIVPMYVFGWCSGIGHTTLQLVKAFDEIAKTESLPFDLTLYSQNTKGTGVSNLGLSLSGVHLYFPYRSRWNHTLSHLPIREMITGGYDLWHCPHNFDFVRHPEKSVVTIHDAMMADGSMDSTLHDKSFKNQTLRLARQCKGIITCSHFSKRQIASLMGVSESKVYITPGGCETERFKFQKQKQNYFLATSCSMFRKNTISVIYAYKLFLQDHPESDYQLKIVWSNPPQEILHLCHGEIAANKIKFLQNLSDEEMALMYQNARVCLFPSLAEGFGLPILESMACGTPIITCRNTSLEEVGGNKALYVKPYDIREMARLMWQLTHDSDEYSELQAEGRCWAETFSWQKCARQTLDIYQQLLNS